jgi:hypothetical protein
MKTQPVLGQTKEKRKFLVFPHYLCGPDGKWTWQWLRMRTVQYEYRRYTMMVVDGPRDFHPTTTGWVPVKWLN